MSTTLPLTGIIDTHAHYDDRAFDKDREQLIDALFADGSVDAVVNAGCDIESSRRSVEFARRYPRFYAWCGIHPSECGGIADRERTLFELEGLLHSPKVVGIGEIGLDFHYETPPRDVQTRWFEWQLQLAARTGKPVAVHDRDAHGACMEIVRRYPGVRGVFHSFSGSAETAAELVELGWYVSFSGVITFRNAERVRAVLASVPLERVLLETDCPYLTPEPNRGGRNDSRNLVFTAAAAAKIKGIAPQELCRITSGNACEFLGIKINEGKQ